MNILRLSCKLSYSNVYYAALSDYRFASFPDWRVAYIENLRDSHNGIDSYAFVSTTLNENSIFGIRYQCEFDLTILNISGIQLTNMHLQHSLDSSCDIIASTGGYIPASLRNIAHSELRISDHGDGVILGQLHQPQPQNTTGIDLSDNSRENFGTTPSTTLILYIIASAAWFQHTIRGSAHYAIC